MDKATVQSMRAYLESTLIEFNERFGVQAKIGGITYGDSNCKMSLTVSDINEDGTVSTKEAENFKTLANSYGLNPEMLGQEFTFQGDIYIINGLNTRASKFPIQCTRKNDGTRFKMPVDLIKRALNIAPSTLPSGAFVR